MSIWGSKKKGNDEEGHGSAREFGEQHTHDSLDGGDRSSQREPTERDRLLPLNPRPPHSDGYLDPDDPAVSPYNLWTVRALRSVTVLFAAITFVWWVLLFVSIFVSPPGLHTRGSGFLDFSYTTLTLGLLLCSLLFFSAPSMAMRVCQASLAVLLLVDLLIIVSVGRVRSEEGPPGIASAAWATAIAAWCVMLDRVVAWGKREEEERLTGRPETRRTLREWLSVLLATIILVIYIVIVVFMTAALIIRSRDASLKWDGDRIAVDGGKFKVHLTCVGNSSIDATTGKPYPTVLLEAAEEPVEYDFENLLYTSKNNGTISRYCYWDRPGYAFSDNAPSPHSAGMAAENLAEALAIQGEQGPWILVSAGYGSIVSRIFSSRNREDVVGIMLIDPLHEDFLHQLASPTRGFMLWAWGVISPLAIQRILGALFQGRTREDRVYGKDVFSGGKFLKAQLQESLVADSLTLNEVRTARTIQDKETPLVVVSSGIKTRSSKEWEKKQEDLTKITGNLVSWDIVNKAPHHVWRTSDGKNLLEKRLGKLVKEGRKLTHLRAEAEHN
ncbi:Hypothetical protein R9X50_00553500 [Acrodontium crateriforme]|uniref:Mitochondrial integral membrane protein n=1 Tax=Acrodontium crateriforme TaxID=150365 RepID=A0AAQ3R969_9PEZI|nr:Hypothetical protein R9X50_00553500 [Acrodontium crateriforme]